MRVNEEWLFTPQRAAIHLPTQTVVVADLHLGYNRTRQNSGEAVPLCSVAEELASLTDLLAREKVTRLVIAGDLYEDGRLEHELREELTAWLGSRQVEPVAFVPGNHDRGAGKDGPFPVYSEGFHLGDWLVVHGDKAAPPGRIVQGHEHPWIRFGRGVQSACFLLGDDHLVLPAYSADAAGVNVLGDQRWSRYRCLVIAGPRVLDFGETGTIRERLPRGV